MLNEYVSIFSLKNQGAKQIKIRGGKILTTYRLGKTVSGLPFGLFLILEEARQIL